jgi:hypothetical protein
MTDYIATLALTLAGCAGVYLIWLMKQPLPPERHEDGWWHWDMPSKDPLPPERHQMDDDQPPVRIKMWMREPGE